jgi:hypothetical protein
MKYRRKGYGRMSRKKSYKKGGRKRNGPTGRVSSRHTLTNIVQTVVRRNAELKWFGYVDDTLISTIPSIDSICDVPQGTTDNTRVGDSLNLSDVLLKIAWFQNAAPTPVNTISFAQPLQVRLMVIQWYPSVTIPALTDILDNVVYSNIYAPVKHDKRQMFRVLYDKLSYIVNGTDRSMHQFIFSKKFNSGDKLSKVQYLNGSTQGTNKLFTVSITDAVLSNQLTCWINSRIRYIDS